MVRMFSYVNGDIGTGLTLTVLLGKGYLSIWSGIQAAQRQRSNGALSWSYCKDGWAF